MILSFSLNPVWVRYATGKFFSYTAGAKAAITAYVRRIFRRIELGLLL